MSLNFSASRVSASSGRIGLLASVSFVIGLLPRQAPAQSVFPSGGSVTAGAAAISTERSAVTVRQTSSTAIIDWTSFSVGAGNVVRFENGTGATLNRVNGFSPSQIDGALSASGSLFLVNPNGIVIGPSGQVLAGGSFVASTHPIADAPFGADGTTTFRGTSTAGIVNLGTIASAGGDVALIARRVENAGNISAPNGTAGLAAGYEVLLRDGTAGDGKLLVKVGGADTEAKTTGVIRAADVELRAHGGNVYALAGNTQGLTKATGVANRGGRVFLTAGEGGEVEVAQTVAARRTTADGKSTGGEIRVSGGRAKISGSLDAAGSGDAGGLIVVTGSDIALASKAWLDASGTAGGVILVGGDWQGGADGSKKILPEWLRTASTTTVEAGARLIADGGAGAGGRIVVWSDRFTSFAGAISATGAGAAAGGDAEVSGKARLAYSGTADLRSETGRFGTLLLDPYNLTISSATSSGMSGFDAGADDSVLKASTLTDALGTANVTVTTGSSGSQAGDITVAAPLAWSSNSTLTLKAEGNIAFSAPVTATGASAGLAIDYGTGKNYSVAAPITLTGASAVLKIGAAGSLQTYTLVRSLDDLASINADATALSGKYALAQDIAAASGTTYSNSLIGLDTSTAFTGIFAGLGHTVSGVTISRSAPTTTATGFFGFVGAGTVRDLGLIDADITVTGATTGHSAGSLIGRATVSTATINNVYAGGANGSVSVTVTGAGTANVGGLIGNSASSISNAYSTASVDFNAVSTSYGGGLAGATGSSASVTNAYATGSVTGTSGGNAYVGGLLGWSYGNITRAYATGALSTTTTSTTGSYTFAGGLVGRNSGTAKTYTDVYASGTVSGSASGGASFLKMGGIVGDTGSMTITRGFWDKTTSGLTAAYGIGVAPTGGVGLTTAQARTQAGYTGADFANTWYQAGDMRPIGRWELSASGGFATVTNLHQLQLLGTKLDGAAVLAADIDAGATNSTAASSGIWGAGGFVPIGTSAAPFTGRFDGRSYTTSGLTIARSSSNEVGLFGATSSASISNLTISGGSVTGASNVGALIGSMLGGSVASVTSSASVTGSSATETNVGGLVGTVDGGSVTVSSSGGSVSGAGYQVGGLVGYLVNGGTIGRSFATGNVTGTNSTDGYGYIGGLVGASGYTGVGGTISESYATGDVTGAAGPIGGFIGHNQGAISNSYATGNVTGTGAAQNVGGFVGVNFVDGTIASSFSIGQVSGGTQTGGFAGYNNNASSGSIASAFWNTQTSGQATGSSGEPSGVTGLTTARFQDTSAFMTSAGAAWNFDTTWAPPSSGYYPQLYALTPVVWAKAVTSRVYGESSGTARTTSVQGGPSSYVFAPSGDTLTVSDKTISVDPTVPVGSTTVAAFAENATSTSASGKTYRVFWYESASPTITPATLTVTAANGTMQYGDSVPALGYTATGWKNGQSSTLLTGVSVGTDATSTSNVGTGYATTASGGTLSGAAVGNYTFTYVAGTFSVTARPITVTADAKSRDYGDANPVLSYTVGGSGLVNGDTLSGALSTSAASSSDVGNYPITIGTLSASSNYDLTSFTGSSLSVARATLTVTAANGTMRYGDAVPTLGYTATGWKNGQSSTLLTGVTVATDATSTSNIGTGYATTASGGTLSGAAVGNYTFGYVAGTFSVTARPITATADAKSKRSGEANPALSYTVGGSGLANGDTLSGALSTTAVAGSRAGRYPITQGTLLASGNYTLTFVQGELTVVGSSESPPRLGPLSDVAPSSTVPTGPFLIVQECTAGGTAGTTNGGC